MAPSLRLPLEHRDLKPANIVITPRGHKILDFGLARITESTSAEAAVTVSPTFSANALAFIYARDLYSA